MNHFLTAEGHQRVSSRGRDEQSTTVPQGTDRITKLGIAQ